MVIEVIPGDYYSKSQDHKMSMNILQAVSDGFIIKVNNFY